MEMEINNLYNSYATSYMNATNPKKQTDISNQKETGAQSGTSAEKTANNDAGSMKANGSRKYLKTLQKKMTHVQLETGFGLNTKKDNKVGTITLNPKILEKMQNDPEAEKKYTQMIKDIEKAEKTVGAYYNALGGVVEHSSHWYIDENGHYCHFGYVRRDDKLNQKLREEAQKNAEKQIEKTRENARQKAEQITEKLEEKAEEAEETEETTKTATSQNNADTGNKSSLLEQLQEKYSGFNVSAGTFSGNQISSQSKGFQGVTISPVYLSKAETDKKTAKKLNEMLGGVEDAYNWLKNAFKSEGLELVSCGYYIDENGNMGSWSVVEKKNSIFDGLKRQNEESADRIKEKKAKDALQGTDEKVKTKEEKALGNRIDYSI